ncbi:hypothetical protein ASPCAL05549 [Aspergillus calidoustus]|uniref:Uncharacterized protein n=1 Tax=Aspergillus calidoustus TaxID=454130 RepID=A0A0U5FYH4_ASPCI|nr:hypothetical protein ASPCAL05549 [Aspergillus calidoustus]
MSFVVSSYSFGVLTLLFHPPFCVKVSLYRLKHQPKTALPLTRIIMPDLARLFETFSRLKVVISTRPYQCPDVMWPVNLLSLNEPSTIRTNQSVVTRTREHMS